MTTVKKMKEREETAEQVRKEMYEDTATNSQDDDSGDQADSQHDDNAAFDGDLQTSNLAEDNRKLSEALKALQGKYNAEVPRLTQQLRDTQMQLEQAKASQNKAEEDAQKAYDKLDEQLASLRADYGDEIVDVLETLASQKKDTSQQVSSAESEDKKFWNNLYRRVPELDQINIDPAFIAWLQQPMENGLSRQQGLNDARDDLDYDSCAKIFDAFKREQKPSKQSKAEDFQSTPRSQKREPQSKRHYTPNDWVKFQQDVQKGRYRGREAEAAQLEREIHAAIHGS